MLQRRNTEETITLQATVAATDTHTSETITATLQVIDEADADGDGLIEIHDLTMLHNMRHNLAGTSYKNAADATGVTTGCPGTSCTGYELVSDLDFDMDGDGTTWSGDSTNGYTLDNGDSQAPYSVASGGEGGWLPIGDCGANNECGESSNNDDSPFTTTFEGNGHVIRNLAIRRDQTTIGLFGRTDNATIRNLGLEEALANYTGSSNRDTHTAPLVGQMDGGTLTASYATGTVDGEDGDYNNVGGLVGFMRGGTLTASYASSTVDGGDGGDAQVGGLVGFMRGGTLTANYASGTVDGGDGDYSQVGGLVGFMGEGTLTASYASGTVDGGDGDYSQVGGLVGSSEGTLTASYASGNVNDGDGNSAGVGGLVGGMYDGTLTTSYATGNVNGGGGNDDVGGLLGHMGGPLDTVVTLTANYATGTVNGGDGGDDRVGGLVGQMEDGEITASYGFGTATGEATNTLGSPPDGVTRATALTLATAGNAWNDPFHDALNAWDFGDSNQPPALLYNDYDGSDVNCARFAVLNIQCGTLIPGQRTATTPQPGTTASDIRFTGGDLADSVTASVLLPTTLTVGDNTLDLMWSIHHDPETTTARQVTLNNNRLLVDADRRASARRIILRATTGAGDDKTLVNDYTLRITPREGERARANLRLTAAPGHLLTNHTTRFTATSDGWGAITWSIVEGGTAATIDPHTGVVTAGATAETITVQTSVAQTSTHSGETLTTSLEIDDFENFERSDFADHDRDGLIEIHDLTMLHNMRYNLAGTSYKESVHALGTTLGCPDTGCIGYELLSDLDFDMDGDGTTWSGDSTRGYTLDDGDSQAPWFITAYGGWVPIGDSVNPFTATFEGNGYVIRNLAIRRNQPYIGLFGYTHNATLRNLGLEQALADYTGSSNGNCYRRTTGRPDGWGHPHRQLRRQ